MSANTFIINFFSLSEIIALIVIARLWMRHRLKIFPCLIWSVVLLVPFFGLMVYVFLHEEPEAHPYKAGDSGWNVGGDGSPYSGHSGDGGDGGH